MEILLFYTNELASNQQEFCIPRDSEVTTVPSKPQKAKRKQKYDLLCFQACINELFHLNATQMNHIVNMHLTVPIVSESQGSLTDFVNSIYSDVYRSIRTGLYYGNRQHQHLNTIKRQSLLFVQ